jgi:hypothetical protein
VRAGRNADGIETSGNPGLPSGRHQQAVAAQFTLIIESQNVVFATASRGCRVHAQNQFDAVAAEFLAKGVPKQLRLAGEDMPGAFDQCNLSAKTAHRLRHLCTDRAAAQYQKPPRNGLHSRHFATGPDTIQLAQAWDGWYHRI